jgi:hypothetical protein
LAALEAVQPAQQPDQLLLGTSAGLFLLDLQTLSLQLLGLPDNQVSHVSYTSGGLVLASCPFTEDANACRQQQANEAAAAGLYCLRLPAGSTSSSSSGSSSPFAACSDSSVPVSKLWDGNARCSAAAAAGSEAAVPRIYVGAQPANVLYSDDMGHTWESSGLAAAPSAGGWYCRLPPYEPSVRSICLSNSRSSSVSSSGCAVQAQEQQQQRVLVGVEVIS